MKKSGTGTHASFSFHISNTVCAQSVPLDLMKIVESAQSKWFKKSSCYVACNSYDPVLLQPFWLDYVPYNFVLYPVVRVESCDLLRKSQLVS